MKYILTFVPIIGIIAWHDAWQSIECPLLLAVGLLVCLTIKTKSNEQREKKGTGAGR